MGSEIGVDEMLQGAQEAVEMLPLVTVICVGDEKLITSRLRKLEMANLAAAGSIAVALEDHAGEQYLKLDLPIHASVPSAAGTLTAVPGRFSS